jgi:hypothetical protein
MPLAIGSAQPGPKRESRPATLSSAFGSVYSIAEINAYIAIRDRLLEQAEKLTTEETLDRVSLANDFVAGCLIPPRCPYEAQCLPDADAANERSRCGDVKARIAKLRALIANADWR